MEKKSKRFQDRNIYLPTSSNQKGFELRIPGLIHSDEGNYTCIVRNGNAMLRHTFVVEAINYINHVPRLDSSSGNVTVMEGMPAELYCDYSSDLGVITSWTRTKGKVDENFDKSDPNNFETLLDQDGNLLVGPTLSFERTHLNDSGLYICVGKNNYKFTTHFLFLDVLSVNEAVLAPPQNVTAEMGQSAVFTCRTHFELRRYMSWIRVKEEEIEILAEGTEVYRVDNVTYEDQGLYSCVIGSDDVYYEDEAYLTVVEEELIAAQPTSVASDRKRLQIIAVSISILSLVLFVAVVVIYFRCQRERIKKQQYLANAHAVTQWTKKVIIERQASHLGPDTPIIAPIIRIEKQNSIVNSANRSRLGSENTTLTTVSEYELPLDPDWEFPRSQLQVGSTLGEGYFGKVNIFFFVPPLTEIRVWGKNRLSCYHSKTVRFSAKCCSYFRSGKSGSTIVILLNML